MFNLVFFLALLCSGDIAANQDTFQQLKAEHAIIFYTEGDRKEAELSVKVIESAWTEFSQYLPITNIEPVQVWIVHKSEDFVSMSYGRSPFFFGGVARPGSGIIVVKASRLRSWGEDFAGTLRHELVHVFLSRAGLDDRLPLWFNEGLAMFLANEYYWSTGLRMSQIVLTYRLIEYRNLDRELMLTTSPDTTSSAYTQSLSMVQYLWKQLGKEKFWEMVKSCKEKSFVESLREVGGMSLDEFWNGYTRSLWIVTLIGTLATGSIFTPIAVLAVIVFLWVWRRNRKKLKAWEEEEEEDEQLGIHAIPWEHLTQEPYDWEMDDDDE